MLCVSRPTRREVGIRLLPICQKFRIRYFQTQATLTEGAVTFSGNCSWKILARCDASPGAGRSTCVNRYFPTEKVPSRRFAFGDGLTVASRYEGCLAPLAVGLLTS